MQLKKLIKIFIVLVVIYSVIPMKEMQIQTAKVVEEIQEIIPEIAEEITQEEKEIIQENLEISFEMNLLTPSNVSVETLEKMFANTKMAGLGQYFVNAEKETGINALYLAGLACHESGWNTSDFAKTRNNLFGWQAYDSNLNATKKFASKEECIMFVADKIKVLYLEENGMFHSGYTISSISKRYASDKQHAEKVFKNMEKMLDKLA